MLIECILIFASDWCVPDISGIVSTCQSDIYIPIHILISCSMRIAFILALSALQCVDASASCPRLTISEKNQYSGARKIRSDKYDAGMKAKYEKVKSESLAGRIVRVIFARHAESDENAGNYVNMAADNIVDARLSQLGVTQAMELDKFVNSKSLNCEQNYQFWGQNKSPLTTNLVPNNRCDIAEFMRGDSSLPVMIGTSSLSRAILTGVIGFRSRIGKLDGVSSATGRVHMLSLLEEVTSGWTSQMSESACVFPRLQGKLSFSLLGKYPALKRQVNDDEYFNDIATRFDLTGAQLDRNEVPKKGKFWKSNVPQDNKNKRFLDFCHWAMSEKDVNDVMVVGHSNWIREFLISRLQRPVNEIEQALTQTSPKIKLGNASVLAFEITYSGDHNIACTVVPNKTEFVFGVLDLDKKIKLPPPQVGAGHIHVDDDNGYDEDEDDEPVKAAADKGTLNNTIALHTMLILMSITLN